MILPMDVAQQFSGSAAAANVKLIGMLTGNEKMVVERAYAESLSSMWVLYVSMAALGLVISTLITRQELATEHVETRRDLRRAG